MATSILVLAEYKTAGQKISLHGI